MRRKKKKPEADTATKSTSTFFPKVQTKLAIGTPGDKYEVEADTMADRVVNNTGAKDSVQKKGEEEEIQQKPLATSITPLLQKAEASEEEKPVQKKGEEEEPIQAMEEEETVQKMEEEEPIQAKEDEEPVQAKKENSNETNASLEGKLRQGNGGTKMDAKTQHEMETGFGADFSAVNIHNDSEAAQMSQDIGAQAFTHKNDVYFNEGKYDTNSKKGKHLLAHELTHTIQQGANKTSNNVQKQNARSSCVGESAIDRYIRSDFTHDITIPSGCNASLHFSAKWISSTPGYNECSTGANTYQLSINEGHQRNLPAGANICGDIRPNDERYRRRTISVGSGRKVISVSVATPESPNLKLHINLRTVIH